MSTTSEGDLLVKYLGNGVRSDLTLVVGTTKYKVHKIILCLKSKYFTALLESAFKESDEREITLHDDDSAAFLVALKYIYSGDYARCFETSSDDLRIHVNVFTIADKYDISGLGLAATNCFTESLSTCWDTQHFLDAIETVFSAEDLSVGLFADAIQLICEKHFKELVFSDSFVKALERTNKLAANLLLRATLKAGPALWP